MNPVYLEFRKEAGVALGARIPSVAVPEVGELVSLRGTIYRAESRSWLYDGEDEDACVCVIRVTVHA